MNKVAIYARVSTDVDGGQTYDRQISDLTKVINYHGYKDNQIEIYAEKLSGYNKERPLLAKLLSEADQFKCIYISEISRLGRDPSHTRKIIDELTDKNIPVYIQSIGQTTLNPDGSRNTIMSIILQVLMEFAHSESETMKTRMKSGKLQKITKEGLVPTSNPAYGYKNKDKKLVLDVEEAEVIKMIFELALEQNGTYLIAQKLNQMNIPTRRSKTHKTKGFKLRNTDLKMDASNFVWNDVTVRQIIKNPIYFGKGIYKGVTYDTPAIITEEVYSECNNIITSRITKGDATFTYLLKNLMYCGKCGKKYVGVYQPTTKAQKAYRCITNKRRTECTNSTPLLFLVESVFYDMFLSTDITSYVENPNDIKNNLVNELENIQIEINNIKSELEEKEAEKKRILKLYAGGKFNEELLDEMNNEIQSDLSSINEKLGIKKKKELELNRAILNYNEDFNSFDLLANAKGNRSELRNIFKQLISKVIINKINDGYALLTFYAKVNGVTIDNPLKIIINTKATRKNPHTGERSFNYLTTLTLENEPIFDDNILLNETDLMEELHYIIGIANKQEFTATKLPYNFKIVDPENYIYMDEKVDK